MARPPRKTLKKVLKKKPRGATRNGGMRSNASSVLAQGVGSCPKKAFGSKRTSGTTLAVWDAKLPHHLSLPRAVGPYTVVRTTRRFSSTARTLVFGAFKAPNNSSGFGAGDWTDICCVLDVNAGQPINSVDNVFSLRSPLNFLERGSSMATCTPSAVSVQILNPQPLQTTSGIIYAGVCNTQMQIGQRDESWDELFNSYIQYQSPRLMSAAKLALKGVQINSYPLSMSQLSEFTSLLQYSDRNYTYDSEFPESTGWAPILVYNTQSVDLEYLVTTEWRVRFDLSNPASAGHSQHPVSTDSVWDKLTRGASAMGNGVRDISDLISNGAAAYSTAKAALSAVELLAM